MQILYEAMFLSGELTLKKVELFSSKQEYKNRNETKKNSILLEKPLKSCELKAVAATTGDSCLSFFLRNPTSFIIRSNHICCTSITHSEICNCLSVSSEFRFRKVYTFSNRTFVIVFSGKIPLPLSHYKNL